MASSTNTSDSAISLDPPQLPPFLASVFNLKPILGSPSPREVNLVHNAIRALNNVSQTPELRDTKLSVELSQHLFDIQMACHRQKHPVNVLPNEVVYDPPNLPDYIPLELKSITGPPSSQEIASVHTALRISESFANVPSIFDPELHAELSQHLFDIQLARHVQRSMVKQSKVLPPASATPIPHENTHNQGAGHYSNRHESQESSSLRVSGSTEPRDSAVEQPNLPEEITDHQESRPIGDLGRTNELIIELKETMGNMTRVLIGSQNSLARGFNSSSRRFRHASTIVYNLGAHSLINDRGEAPETYNLPAFQNDGCNVIFPLSDINENTLARYLRFYGIGEEMIEEGEVLKIKSGLMDDAKALLSKRLFLNR